MSKAVAVYVDGPFSAGLDWREENEIPEWVVFAGDEEGEAVSKVYRPRSWALAKSLGRRMAADRGLELVDESHAA